MKIQNIIDVLDLFEGQIGYYTEELEDNIEYMIICIYNNDNSNLETMKKIYFNSKTGYIISNYEKKKEIKKQIKKLQEELENLE